MAEIDLPTGHYYSLSGLITAGTGGQTRALLLRNRLLAQRSGVEPVILTFDRKPRYPMVRADLRRRGELVDPMQLVNIFEWYRENDIDDLPTTGEPLWPLEGYRLEDQLHPDGTVYSTHHLHPRSNEETIVDYRRPDGSVFLRLPSGVTSKNKPATDVILVNSKGDPVGNWPTNRGFRQNWIRALTPLGERAFIISDSRFAINYILPMSGDDLHVLYVMHNMHVAKNQWNATIHKSFKPLLDQIDALDGFVGLTARQCDDVAQRFGHRNNMFVVPNPVELPERPDLLPERDPKRFAVVARLEPQKQLEQAIRAFALVLEEEPDAKLDIYGDGSRQIQLQREIAQLGVKGSVTLKGHDPRARDSLWTASGFLLTSAFEGFPLAPLESLSFGCPVIAYDVKYGLREQVTDGVDGFLVAPGDIRGVADRILQMIRDPELVSRLSQAAFVKAKAHDHTAFLKQWRRVLNTVVRNKDRRTHLESVNLTVTQLGYDHGLAASIQPVVKRLPDRLSLVRLAIQVAGNLSASASFHAGPTIHFAGKLTVVGTSKTATLDDVLITLDGICDASGSVVSIPVRTRRSGDTFDVSASIDVERCFRTIEARASTLRLRLRLVWHNSSWETYLARPKAWTANYEAAFAATGQLTLLRGTGAPR